MPAGSLQERALDAAKGRFAQADALLDRVQAHAGVDQQILNAGLAYGTLRLFTPTRSRARWCRFATSRYSPACRTTCRWSVAPSPRNADAAFARELGGASARISEHRPSLCHRRRPDRASRRPVGPFRGQGRWIFPSTDDPRRSASVLAEPHTRTARTEERCGFPGAAELWRDSICRLHPFRCQGREPVGAGSSARGPGGRRFRRAIRRLPPIHVEQSCDRRLV